MTMNYIATYANLLSGDEEQSQPHCLMLPSLRGHVAQPRLAYQIKPPIPSKARTTPAIGHTGETNLKDTPANSKRGSPQQRRCNPANKMTPLDHDFFARSSIRCFLSLVVEQDTLTFVMQRQPRQDQMRCADRTRKMMFKRLASTKAAIPKAA